MLKLESYGDLALVNLAIHCMNLYELYIAIKMICYGYLSHNMPLER